MLIASIYLLPSLRTPWQACPVSWGLAVTSRTWPRSTERCTPASPRCPRTSSGVWSTSRSAAKCTASSSGNTERPGPGGWVSYLLSHTEAGLIRDLSQERQGPAGSGHYRQCGVLAVHVARWKMWPRFSGLSPPPLLPPWPQHRLWMRHHVLASEKQTRVHTEIR